MRAGRRQSDHAEADEEIVMSLDQELEGQSKFRTIVLGFAPDAVVTFGEVSSNERYEVTIISPDYS